MGEEGREPIYGQARGLRMGRLPRYSPSIPFILWRFLEKQNIQGWGELAGKDARSEPHQWAVDIPDWLGTGHLLVRFARGEGAPSADRKDNLIFCDDFALGLDNFSILKVCQGYVTQGKNRYFRRSHLSEAKFRALIRYFAHDFRAWKIAELSGVSRPTINQLFMKLRIRIAQVCNASSPLSGEFGVDES